MEFKSNLDDTENSFSMLLKSIPIPALLWKKMNNSLTLVNSNDESSRISGGKIKEYIGRKASDIYKNDSKILKGMQDCVLNNHKFSIAAKNGNPIVDNGVFYKISFELIAPDTVVQYFIENSSVNMEIHKTRELDLIESEEKYRILSENSDDLITLYDEKFRVIYINAESHSRVLGYPAKKFLKASFKNIIAHKDDVITLINIVKKGIEEGSYRGQIRFKHQKGHYMWFQITAKFFSVKPESRKLLVIAREITDIKQFEQDLRESEEKYRGFVNNISDIIFEIDIKGRCSYVSHQLLDISGFAPEEMTGQNVFKFVHPEDLIMVAEEVKRAFNSEDNRYIEFKLRHKDGHYVSIASRFSTIRIGGEKKLTGVLVDITERKKAEQNLKESEEQFRTIAEQAFMGIMIIQDNKLTYVNAALSDIFEFSSEETEGWTKDDIVKLVHPQDLEYLVEYRQNLRDGIPDIKNYYSYRVFTKSGKLKWIDQFSKNIVYKGESAELITIIDITEKKGAEEELIKLNNLKSELFVRTSHELKTPLVSIKGFSDLLLTVHRSKLDDYSISKITAIKNGADRLQKLIGDILKAAELESGYTKINLKNDNLSNLIHICVKEVQGFADLRNHELEINIQQKLIANFEEEQIHKVVSNLLSNAIKYTPPNGKIEIKSEIKNNLIITSIKDNGIGFTREEKQKIFKQFGKIERYGQNLEVVPDGTGLGLFISRKMVELHGGEIWVESEGRNQGSTFYFTLPLTQSQ